MAIIAAWDKPPPPGFEVGSARARLWELATTWTLSPLCAQYLRGVSTGVDVLLGVPGDVDVGAVTTVDAV